MARKLKRYTVTLVRTIEYRAIVEDVDAANEGEAIDKAILVADNPTEGVRWIEGDTIGESSKAKANP